MNFGILLKRHLGTLFLPFLAVFLFLPSIASAATFSFTTNYHTGEYAPFEDPRTTLQMDDAAAQLGEGCGAGSDHIVCDSAQAAPVYPYATYDYHDESGAILEYNQQGTSDYTTLPDGDYEMLIWNASLASGTSDCSVSTVSQCISQYAALANSGSSVTQYVVVVTKTGSLFCDYTGSPCSTPPLPPSGVNTPEEAIALSWIEFFLHAWGYLLLVFVPFIIIRLWIAS